MKRFDVLRKIGRVAIVEHMSLGSTPRALANTLALLGEVAGAEAARADEHFERGE